MIQVISLVGSLLILSALAGNQFGKVRSNGLPYVVLNVVGSAILSVIAILEEQWGFLLLEGVWTLVSTWSLWRLLRAPGGAETPAGTPGLGH